MGAIAFNIISINNPTSKTEEQFEEWQADRTLNRTAELKTELIMVEKKRQALREFLAEARSHEGEILEWLASLKHQDYPGKDLGLSIQLDLKTED